MVEESLQVNPSHIRTFIRKSDNDTFKAPVVSLADACILRGDKDQEKFAKSELSRELRYLNVTAFKDPISHLFGWRVGKVARRIGNAVTGVVNMVL